MQPRIYNIDELRCTTFSKGGQHFDLVRHEDFMRETGGFSFPHRHNYYMLLLVTGGKGKQVIDFQTYDVEARQLFLMQPGIIHAWEDNRDITGYTLFFTADFFAQRYHYDSLMNFPFFQPGQVQQPFVALDDDAYQEVRQLMGMMYDEYKNGSEGMWSALRSLLNVLLIKAARQYGQPQKTISESKQQSAIIAEFQLLIEQHYLDKKLVRDYASLLNITPNYLNILSKQITGKAAGDLIRERLMLEARRRLIYEKKQVAEIAYDLNFKDSAYFCRFFRKYEQQSPEQFRRTLLTA